MNLIQDLFFYFLGHSLSFDPVAAQNGYSTASQLESSNQMQGM